MKKYIYITTLLLSTYQFAQVTIGKENIEGTSTLIDFVEGDKRGILLPINAELPADAVPGTLVVSAAELAVMLKVTDSDPIEINNWQAVSVLGKGVLPENYSETDENDQIQGVIIGDTTDDSNETPGVLILESSTKAMVLPKVNDPVSNMPSPVIGTLVFDTSSNSIAFFDGANWNFWK